MIYSIKILKDFIKKLLYFFFISDTQYVFRLINIALSAEGKNAVITYQIIGLNKLVSKNLDQVYKNDIEGFSKYEAKYIGFLYGRLNSSAQDFYRLIPANSNNTPIAITPKAFFLATLSISCLVLSNLVGPKITAVFGYEFNAGLLFFPIILIISDITTEVYGYKVNRILIWFAFVGNIFIALGIHLVVILPSAKVWLHQDAYLTVFNSSLRTLAASAIAFIIGEFVNSYIIAKLKILTLGKFLWFRMITSTAIGTGFDNLIFYFVAFYGLVPMDNLISIGLFGYVVGILYEILMLPLIYKIVNFLKRSEGKDIYDINTDFNPFKL